MPSFDNAEWIIPLKIFMKFLRVLGVEVGILDEGHCEKTCLEISHLG